MAQPKMIGLGKKPNKATAADRMPRQSALSLSSTHLKWDIEGDERVTSH